MMISVIGGSKASKEEMSLAESVGRILAQHDVTVICGGGGGVMEGVCKGARNYGGHTVGIMPGRNVVESPPNEWVEFPVFTGLGFARNSIVVLSGQSVIAIGGSYGTLNEISFSLIHEIPVIGLGTWGFSYDSYNEDKIIRTDTPDEAVKMALELSRM